MSEEIEHELVKHLPDLDGEFAVDEESGFGCDLCGHPLPVGSSSCPGCKRHFKVPTPHLLRLAKSKHPAKMQGMALIHGERLISSEINALIERYPTGVYACHAAERRLQPAVSG